MPLLVRLTDSEVDTVDGALAQASNCIENTGGVFEQVSSVGC